MERNPDHICPVCKSPTLTTEDLVPIAQRTNPNYGMGMSISGERGMTDSPVSSSSDGAASASVPDHQESSLSQPQLAEDPASKSKPKRTHSRKSSADKDKEINGQGGPPAPFVVPFEHLRPSRNVVTNWVGHAFTIAAFAIFLFALFPSSSSSSTNPNPSSSWGSA